MRVYGHNCGDYTLKELSRLFLTSGEGKYTLCRWGGEEFCFFMPGMNIDQAGRVSCQFLRFRAYAHKISCENGGMSRP